MELATQFSGASGLISVSFFFSSKGDVSFFENALKALNQFFFAGLQGQQLFLVLALELSVNGLLLKDRQPHISKVNRYLPDNSHISVSFHNGPRNFIVTGTLWSCRQPT